MSAWPRTAEGLSAAKRDGCLGNTWAAECGLFVSSGRVSREGTTLVRRTVPDRMFRSGSLRDSRACSPHQRPLVGLDAGLRRRVANSDTGTVRPAHAGPDTSANLGGRAGRHTISNCRHRSAGCVRTDICRRRSHVPCHAKANSASRDRDTCPDRDRATSAGGFATGALPAARRRRRICDPNAVTNLFSCSGACVAGADSCADSDTRAFTDHNCGSDAGPDRRAEPNANRHTHARHDTDPDGLSRIANGGTGTHHSVSHYDPDLDDPPGHRHAHSAAHSRAGRRRR